jgi:hypothetical protein
MYESSAPLTEEELAALEKLYRHAVPGPWNCGNTTTADYWDVQGPSRGSPAFDHIVIAHADPDEYPNRREAESTMRLIEALHQSFPRLASMVRDLQRRLAEAEQQRDGWQMEAARSPSNW